MKNLICRRCEQVVFDNHMALHILSKDCFAKGLNLLKTTFIFVFCGILVLLKKMKKSKKSTKDNMKLLKVTNLM